MGGPVVDLRGQLRETRRAARGHQTIVFIESSARMRCSCRARAAPPSASPATLALRPDGRQRQYFLRPALTGGRPLQPGLAGAGIGKDAQQCARRAAQQHIQEIVVMTGAARARGAAQSIRRSDGRNPRHRPASASAESRARSSGTHRPDRSPASGAKCCGRMPAFEALCSRARSTARQAFTPRHFIIATHGALATRARIARKTSCY